MIRCRMRAEVQSNLQYVRVHVRGCAGSYLGVVPDLASPCVRGCARHSHHVLGWCHVHPHVVHSGGRHHLWLWCESGPTAGSTLHLLHRVLPVHRRGILVIRCRCCLHGLLVHGVVRHHTGIHVLHHHLLLQVHVAWPIRCGLVLVLFIAFIPRRRASGTPRCVAAHTPSSRLAHSHSHSRFGSARVFIAKTQHTQHLSRSAHMQPP